MRICFFAHSLNPMTGIGEFSNNLISGAKSTMGAEATVLTSEDKLPPSYFKILRNLFYIRDQIRSSDIVHALDAYPYGVVAAIANIGIGRPLLITAVGTGSLQFFDRTGWRATLARWAISRADRLTTISKYVSKRVKTKFKGVAVDVITPGVDFSYWSQIEPAEIDAELDGIGPYVLSVGELKRRKGYLDMLDVMDGVLKEVPELKYVIVGNVERSPAYVDELKRKIGDLGISGRVIFLSRLSREELRRVYQRASVYLAMPQEVNGDVEGFGMAILQAAAAGVPAVVGSGSGADDAVVDNQSGFLMAGNDTNHIANYLILMLKDRELRGRLSKGAEEFAKSMSWKSKADRYVLIYKSLA